MAIKEWLSLTTGTQIFVGIAKGLGWLPDVEILYSLSRTFNVAFNLEAFLYAYL